MTHVMPGALPQMDRDTKLRLAAFVCLFAWADKTIHPTERKLVTKLVTELQLLPTDAAKVSGWLATPPPLDLAKVDGIPEGLRQAFFDHAARMITADGKVDAAEKAALERLKAQAGLTKG